MGKHLDATQEYHAKESAILFLVDQVIAKGWRIDRFALFVDPTSYEYRSFLSRLLESSEVIDTGEVGVTLVEGDTCKVRNGKFYIGIGTPIDEVLQFLKE